MNRVAAFALLPALALSLAACGSSREQDELMRRVAQAEAAAKRAEAAASKAEDAARRATGGSAVPETVYEEAEPAYGDAGESDPNYGQGTEPVPDPG